MIRPTVQIKDTGGFEDFLKEITKGLSSAFVTIGVHEDAGAYTEGTNPPSVAEVALWNEFGTREIPERSFLRSAINDNESNITQWLAQAMGRIADSVKSPKTTKRVIRDELGKVGFKIRELIRNKIKSNVPPPNAPSVVEEKKRKGIAPNTLINSGLLLRSINYKVTVK